MRSLWVTEPSPCWRPSGLHKVREFHDENPCRKHSLIDTSLNLFSLLAREEPLVFVRRQLKACVNVSVMNTFTNVSIICRPLTHMLHKHISLSLCPCISAVHPHTQMMIHTLLWYSEYFCFDSFYKLISFFIIYFSWGPQCNVSIACI